MLLSRSFLLPCLLALPLVAQGAGGPICEEESLLRRGLSQIRSFLWPNPLAALDPNEAPLYAPRELHDFAFNLRRIYYRQEDPATALLNMPLEGFILDEARIAARAVRSYFNRFFESDIVSMLIGMSDEYSAARRYNINRLWTIEERHLVFTLADRILKGKPVYRDFLEFTGAFGRSSLSNHLEDNFLYAFSIPVQKASLEFINDIFAWGLNPVGFTEAKADGTHYTRERFPIHDLGHAQLIALRWKYKGVIPDDDAFYTWSIQVEDLPAYYEKFAKVRALWKLYRDQLPAPRLARLPELLWFELFHESGHSFCPKLGRWLASEKGSEEMVNNVLSRLTHPLDYNLMLQDPVITEIVDRHLGILRNRMNSNIFASGSAELAFAGTREFKNAKTEVRAHFRDELVREISHLSDFFNYAWDLLN